MLVKISITCMHDTLTSNTSLVKNPSNMLEINLDDLFFGTIPFFLTSSGSIVMSNVSSIPKFVYCLDLIE